jgi:aminoacrylate hydrolase
MPKAVVGGAGIHYEVVGTGHPLVLTAGQGTGPQARAELIAGLARNHAVLTYDQRGSGRSDPARQDHSIEDLSEDVVALMDVAGFERAHVLGLSTGTGKATALAARHPERVTRLVLAAPWTHGDPSLHVLQGVRKAAARSMPPDHYVHFNALLLYPPAFCREHLDRFVRMAADALKAPQDAAGIAARLDAILAFDARPLYARIACPSLVLGARDDLVMPLWHAQDAARMLPDARLETFEDGGHMFPESRTAAFLAAVLGFLAPPETHEG